MKNEKVSVQVKDWMKQGRDYLTKMQKVSPLYFKAFSLAEAWILIIERSKKTNKNEDNKLISFYSQNLMMLQICYKALWKGLLVVKAWRKG